MRGSGLTSCHWLGLGVPSVAVCLSALLVSACAAAAGALDPAQEPPGIDLAGLRVLMLPVQDLTGVPPGQRERATAELYFALSEHDPEVTWVSPRDLERALRRNPAFASDPERLPPDPLMHHGERRAEDPLASELRRYAALMDVRLVLLPRELRFTPQADSIGVLTLGAVLIDARTGAVLWWGDGTGRGDSTTDPQTLAVAAASLAGQLMGPRAQERKP